MGSIWAEPEEIIEEPELDAHGYLVKVYRDKREPTHVRMRAAALALEVEKPKLKAAAILYTASFAVSLEKAIERTAPALLEGTVIEAEPVPVPQEKG
jgi:hypothetical protein